YYILYHQEPGVAEKEYDADPRGLLSRLYTSKDTPVDAPTVTDPKRSAGGWVPRPGKPNALPALLSPKGLGYYRAEVRGVGVHGVGLPGRGQLLSQFRPQLGDYPAADRRSHQGSGGLHRGRGRHRHSRRQGARTAHYDVSGGGRSARRKARSGRGALGPAGKA